MLPRLHPARRQGTLVGRVSLATTCSSSSALLTFRVRECSVPRALSPFPLPFPHPWRSGRSGPEAKMATPGAASAELVIGWCIFGLLLLVGEALGVFPMFGLAEEGRGRPCSWPCRTPRPFSPRPAFSLDYGGLFGVGGLGGRRGQGGADFRSLLL